MSGGTRSGHNTVITLEQDTNSAVFHRAARMALHPDRPRRDAGGLPRLERIVGRISEYLIHPDGRRQRFLFEHSAVAKIKAVKEFQVIQKTLHRIEVLLAVARPLTDDEAATVRGVMVAAFGNGFEIDLAYYARIPRTAAGKRRPVRSELPQ